MSDILSGAQEVRRLIGEMSYPTQYYVITEMIPPGKVFRIGPIAPYPEVWLFHPDDFACHGAEFSLHCRMVDFRTWQPTQGDITRAFEEACHTRHDWGLSPRRSRLSGLWGQCSDDEGTPGGNRTKGPPARWVDRAGNHISSGACYES